MSFIPYLAFSGNCREAFTTYERLLGGELVLLSFADSPQDAGTPAGAPPDGIMHAALHVGDGWLYGGDDPTGGFDGTVRGMCVCYTASDPDAAKQVFEGLAEGGTVQMPLGATFFAPAFGMCTDRFGTPWMVTAPAGQR
jgi:PhnB protein